jgi:hypothetical protein
MTKAIWEMEREEGEAMQNEREEEQAEQNALAREAEAAWTEVQTGQHSLGHGICQPISTVTAGRQ